MSSPRGEGKQPLTWNEILALSPEARHYVRLLRAFEDQILLHYPTNVIVGDAAHDFAERIKPATEGSLAVWDCGTPFYGDPAAWSGGLMRVYPDGHIEGRRIATNSITGRIVTHGASNTILHITVIGPSNADWGPPRAPVPPVPTLTN